jgi:type IV pilus assembly protein PilP
LDLLSYDDDDFVESERNRDPFRNYATMFKVRALETPQRAVVMPTTSIEQMRLMAIISGVARPRAMLVDPSGVGHVVARGDFIGRPEVVQTGGTDSTPLQLNWRVDRIRATEVVLTREDPTAPGRVPLSRVIPLYDEADRVREGLTYAGEDEPPPPAE